MLKIRLQRVGRKHEPAFRLVLTDSQNSTKSGKFKEILGSYDPRKDTDQIDAERVKYWISNGAQPTDTVHNLLLKHGVIEGEKRNVLPKKTYTPEPVAEETASATEGEPTTASEEAPAEETKTEDAPVEEPKAEETPTE